MHLTLRTKGILALAVLILYIAVIGLFVAHERRKLVLIVQDIESNNATQVFFSPILNSLGHALVQTQTILSTPQFAVEHPQSIGQTVQNLKRIGADLGQVRLLYPSLAQEIDEFGRAVDELTALYSVPHLVKVRDSEQRLVATLNDLQLALQGKSAEYSQNYQDTQQFVSAVAIAANVAGAVGSVAVILVFFTQLAKDIKRLQDRAVAVVAGYDGEPLENTRRDEVGGLIDAVNRMQVDLRRWEQQQEISRQQRFHQEKMAAVGSLAAAISHEVCNPMAAISGIAQFLISETKEANLEACKTCHEFALQILTQTERIGLIMRQMGTLTTPHSPVPGLLDLNALIETTCSFISYDPRFVGIVFEKDLDRNIPAITAVGDHITQVLMNLLINAADAMDPEKEFGQSRIRIASTMTLDEIQLSVTDNGVGMSPIVLAKAFDESFTTKPAGKGRGIGLFLCKTLVEEAGGRIELTSTLGVGTSVHLFLPLGIADQGAA